MTQSLQIDARALERFEVAVARVGTNAEILYANKAMLDLIGADSYAGVRADDWLANPGDWPLVEEQISKRIQGEASSYEILLARVSDGARIPVSVYGVPEVDAEGRTSGSLAFVTNLLESKVQRAMHVAIETRRTDQEILRALDEQLQQLIPYETLRVTLISEERKHLRTLYSTQPNPGPPLHWWKMIPFVEKIIEDDKPKLYDIREFFSREEAKPLLKDPATLAWLEQGYKHTLSIPVKRGERVVALIGLESKADRPYTQAQLDLCARLPLADGALMALQYEEAGRREIVIDLIRELTAAFADEDRSGSDAAQLPGQIRQAARILVNRLARYFEWDHVSIFRHDERTESLRVLDQASHGDLALDKDFAIPVSKGLVGRAFREGRIVNVGNVKTADEGDDYVVGVRNIVSELCIPVPGHPIRWVVNIESKDENAFAEEEVSTVEMLVREAGNILERAALLEMREAVLASVNDAVIVTDSRGIIRRANPAAHSILGTYRRGGNLPLLGEQLAQFIVDENVKTAMAEAKSFPRIEATAIRASEEHEQVRVMISASQLPLDLGGKVFVLSDPTFFEESKRLDLIKEVFRQAALETRIPLALAASYLAQAPQKLGWDGHSVERVLKQLRKADLPLERLLRLAVGGDERREHAAAVDLKEVLGSTVGELPHSEQMRIDLHGADRVMVRMPRESLAFCVESMLSFALRTRPPESTVVLELAQHGPCARVSVRGDWTPVLDSAGSNAITGRWRRKAIEDLSLAGDVLGEMAKRSGGSFHGELEKQVSLDLVLPIDASAKA